MRAESNTRRQKLLALVEHVLGKMVMTGPMAISFNKVSEVDTAAGHQQELRSRQPAEALQPTSRGSMAGFVMAVLAITLLAGALRCYNLGGPSFWIDELFTVRSSAMLAQGQWHAKTLGYVPTAIGLSLAGIDLTTLPPDGYSQWQDAGISELMLRVPSVIIGILTVPILGLYSRRLLGTRGAIIFTLLLAISTWHLWMSQTARFYGQQFLFYNLCLIFYYDATRTRSRRTMAVMGLCMVLAFCTQLTSLMIVGVFAADWLLGRIRREPVRLGRFGIGTILVAFAACLGIWASHFLLEPDVYTGFVGSHQSWRTLLMGTPYMVGAAVAVLAVITAWWLMREQPRLTLFLVLGALVPLATFVFLALQDFDVHIRYTFVGLYSWLALAALGLDRLWEAIKPRLGVTMAAAPILAVAASMMLANYGYFTGGEGYRTRWREAFAYVNTHRQPGELVAMDYIPYIVGQYYLKLPPEALWKLNSATTLEMLQAQTQPTWVVVRTHSPANAGRFGWLDSNADLRAYYATRVLQPYYAVNVYRYMPVEMNARSSDDKP